MAIGDRPVTPCKAKPANENHLYTFADEGTEVVPTDETPQTKPGRSRRPNFEKMSVQADTHRMRIESL